MPGTICPNCQEVNASGEVFCKNCGTFLPPPPAVHNPEQMRETTHRTDANGLLMTLYYILSVFTPAIGIILGAVLIFAGRDEKTKRRGNGLTIFAVIMLLLQVLLYILQPLLSLWLGFLFH